MATDSIAIIKAVFPANAQKYGLRDTQIQADIQAGYISKYTAARPQDCAKASGQDYSAIKATQSSGLGLLAPGPWQAKLSSVISNGLNFIPVVGPLLSQVWNTINPFAHHAAAVAREQATLCSAVPKFDAALGQIEAALKNGSISAAEADAYVDQAVQGFDSEVSGITQQSPCNAACVMRAEVSAVAEVNKEKFRDSPLYYLKHYWWIGAIALFVFLLRGRD